jgi:YYY domain-containing protein
VGLALAPKVNILPLLLPLGLAYLYVLLDSVDGRWARITPRTAIQVYSHAALAAVIAAGVLIVSAPYALLDYNAFFDGIGSQVDMAREAGTLPFTIQYIDTPAFIYQIRQVALWGLGLPLGVIAWLAVPFTAVLALTQRRHFRADLLVLAWVVPTFLFLESFEVRFQRYMIPLTPFLILMGARMLLWTVDFAKRVSHVRRRPTVVRDTTFSFPMMGWLRAQSTRMAWLLLVVVVVSTAFYALAFQNVYAKDHPAVEASEWINKNITYGTKIVSDNHWDEFVPNLYAYDVWQFPVYNEPDNREKMDELAKRLSQAEFLVFYSNRPYSSVARAPDRYPLSNSYYRQLFEGELGYRLERRFTSHPRLLDVSFQDNPFRRAGLRSPEPLVPEQSSLVTFDLGYADDNVVGYDHPQVLLFRNQFKLTEGELRLQLSRVRTDRFQRSPVGLLMTAEQAAEQQGGGTWSKIISRQSWTNGLPVLAWLLVVELVYLAALPLSMFLFRPLPDRGVVLARIVGLLGASYVTWLLVSLGWLDYSRTAIYLGMLALASLSGLVLILRWREIRRFFTQHWRLVLTGEFIFLAAFLAFVAVRAANPDLWHPYRGGEKPMELAYLNAVVRSTSLPPFDPWYAGGYMNYYYWGYFVLAGLIRVTSIVPATAFNLAVPLFFALTFTGAYSLVYNLAEGTRRTGSSAGSVETVVETRARRRRWRISWWTPTGAGLTAGLFVSVIGNLDGIVQIAQGTWMKFVGGRNFPDFDFWRSSRMIPPLDNFDPSPLAFWVPDKIAGSPDVSWHITEFPFFTFLFADLHPHMMVIPFTLLVIGLGLAMVIGLRQSGVVWRVSTSAALAVTLGALWVINSWDYPSYVLFTAAILGLAVYFSPGRAPRKLALLASLGVGIVVLSVVAFYPFHQSYETFQAGLEPAKWRTPLHQYLGIHGLFLFVALTYLLYQTRHTVMLVVRDLLGAFRRSSAEAAGADVPRTRFSWPRVAFALGLLIAVYLAVADYWTAALLMGMLSLTGVAARDVLFSRDIRNPYAIFPLLFLAMGIAISVGVDLVRLEGDIGRMNTQFKYYLEVWVLFSLAAAYMLWYLGSQGLSRLRPNWGRRVWMGVLAAFIGSSLIYTVLGTQVRVADRFNDGPLTLDGTAYMEQAVHRELEQPVNLKWDLEAIQWLQDNVVGSPVVLEAHNDQYRWSGRISTYTGLPTVLGWPWHQIQQRMDYDYTIRDRAARVKEIYETADLQRAQSLMDEYNVEYVVVGELERIYYSPEGISKFEELAADESAQRVFRNDGVSIYRILR